jgi:hypothetical protein
MSLPYLPGWWDSIDKNALSSFISGATSAFAPDATAKFKFDRMVQQDPELLGRISNMDESARQAFAQSLGYRDYGKSGLANIATGQELKNRQAIDSFLSGATKEQLDIRNAGLAGTKPIRDLEREDTMFGLNVKGKETSIKKDEQDIRLNDLELKEKEEFNTLMDTLKIKYPTENIDLNKSLNAYVSGRMDIPEMQRIMNDKTIAPAFMRLVDFYQQRLTHAAQFRLASLKGPEEKFTALQLMERGVDNALAKINSAQGYLDKLGLAGQSMKPEEYATGMTALKEARDEHTRMSNAYKTMLQTEFGGKYPGAFNPENPGLIAPPNVAAPNSFLSKPKVNAPADPRAVANDSARSAFAADGTSRTISRQAFAAKWKKNNPQQATEPDASYRMRFERAWLAEGGK